MAQDPSDKRLGNAAKRLEDTSPGPWKRWKTKDRAERAIRWIETYCILPKGYGSGKPIRLAEFQKAWLRTVLADGVDSAVMEVPRGNGKSTFLAALALWALFDDDPISGAPQVPVVATTMGQAIKSVYGVAVDMVNSNRDLAGRSLTYSAIGNMRIWVPINNGEMFPISNDKDGLQGLDPSLAVCDEIGFMPVESWASLLLASGKRPRSLVVGIGTPGFDRESALWQMRTRVLEGGSPDGFSFIEFAADENCDVHDEGQWHKANPALAEGYMNIRALRTAVEMSTEAHFRIFRLGQWVDGVECWLGDDGRAVWDALCDPFEFVDDADTWLGVDVGLKRDSTAIAAVQKRPDGRLHVKTRIWIPRPDGRLDVTDAMHHIRELARQFRVVSVSFDPRFFDLPAQQLLDEGYPMVEVPQSLEQMVPAVGETFERIKRKELSHDGDPTFDMQVLAAVARYAERGFTLAKSKSRDRIDSAVAMCLAVNEATRTESSDVRVSFL